MSEGNGSITEVTHVGEPAPEWLKEIRVIRRELLVAVRTVADQVGTLVQLVGNVTERQAVTDARVVEVAKLCRDNGRAIDQLLQEPEVSGG